MHFAICIDGVIMNMSLLFVAFCMLCYKISIFYL